MKIDPEACARKNIKNGGWSQYIIENKEVQKRQNVSCQDIYEIKGVIGLSIG